MSVNFLDLINEDQGCDVVLSGAIHFVARARLGRHLQLSQLAMQFDESKNGQERADLIARYFAILGIEVSESSCETVEAYLVLRENNAWKWSPAWLDPKIVGDGTESKDDKRNGAAPGVEGLLNENGEGRILGPPKKKPLPYEFDGRWWAWWIHAIASRYGWSRDHILERLWPEEAAVYMQEIQLSLFNEYEAERALSEVSYEYNKTTKKSRFRATPKPPWMIDNTLPESVRIPKSALPRGAIKKGDD